MRRTALALVVVVIAAFATAAPAGAAASITVTPSTDLVNGQTVSVSVSGFDANTSLAAAQCKAGPISTDDCDLQHVFFFTSDQTGASSFNFSVRSVLSTFNGTVDCAASDGACVLGVAQTADILGTAVTVPLSFAPLGPPRRGILTGPSAPTPDGAGADIAATEFTPNTVLETTVCQAEPAAAINCEGGPEVDTDATGAADFVLYADKVLFTAHGDSIDCTVDGACVYAAWDTRDFTATLATTPVRIAAEVPGSLTVEPSTGVIDGEQVHVSGSGWPADTSVHAFECDAPSAPANCTNALFVKTLGDGTFSTQYTARIIPGASVNCETGSCWIVAIWYANTKPISAAEPISFDLTPTAVTSHYTNAELTAVNGAATTLGISNVEEQRLGAWALAWVLAITRTGTIIPTPDSGPGSITIEWPASQYHAINTIAAEHDTSLAEFQKTGALFLAYVLAL